VYKEQPNKTKPVPPAPKIPDSKMYDQSKPSPAVPSKPGSGYMGSGTDKKNFGM
jgi:hypothetical protein